MASSFWEDPAIRVSSEWVRFDAVGDGVSGTVARLGKKTWPDGSVGIEIAFEGDIPSLTASQVLLKAALFGLKPQVGDHLSVTLAAIEKRPGGKTLKKFKVGIKRADGSVDEIDQTQ